MTPIVADLPERIHDPQPTLSALAVAVPMRAEVSQITSTSPLRSLRVSSEIVASAWFRPVLAQLGTVLSLRQGWDSYEGRAASTHSVERALQFLVSLPSRDVLPPTVVPLSDGGVQLVWHVNGVDAEATFAPNEEPELYLHDLDGDIEFEVDPFAADAREPLRLMVDKLRN